MNRVLCVMITFLDMVSYRYQVEHGHQRLDKLSSSSGICAIFTFRQEFSVDNIFESMMMMMMMMKVLLNSQAPQDSKRSID